MNCSKLKLKLNMNKWTAEEWWRASLSTDELLFDSSCCASVSDLDESEAAVLQSRNKYSNTAGQCLLNQGLVVR